MVERSAVVFAALAAAVVCVAWIFRRPENRTGSLSSRLRAVIIRGRAIPVSAEHSVYDRWVDDAGVWWTRESIVCEEIPSSQQKLPLLVAWPSESASVESQSTSQITSRSNSITPSPVVFVLHGTSRSKSDPAVKKVMAHYASKGWTAMSFDSRYHGERSGLKAMTGKYEQSSAWTDEISKDEREGPYQQALVDALRGSGERPFIFDSAFDLMRCLDYVESRPDLFDASRIGATGISLGGMIVWVAAAADERIKVPVPAIGVQNFQYAIDTDTYGARVDSIKPVFEACRDDRSSSNNNPILKAAEAGAAPSSSPPSAVIDGKTVAAVWDAIVPGLRNEFDAPKSLPLIAPRPLLLLQGAKDPRCPLEGVQLAFQAAQLEYAAKGQPTNVKLFADPAAAHAVTPEMWSQADAWFTKYL